MILPSCPYAICVKLHTEKSFLAIARWLDENTSSDLTIIDQVDMSFTMHVVKSNEYARVSYSARSDDDRRAGILVLFSDQAEATAFTLRWSDDIVEAKIISREVGEKAT